MKDSFVLVDKASLDFAFLLYEKFLDICPEEVWLESFGGRPVGRQIYHAVAATATYLQSMTGKQMACDFPEAIDPFPDSGMPQEDHLPIPSKKGALSLLRNIKSGLDNLLGQLDDADLLLKNEPVSQFLNGWVSNADVLGIMTAHMLYHLGSGDAALRSRGIPGAFSGLSLVGRILAEAGKHF